MSDVPSGWAADQPVELTTRWLADVARHWRFRRLWTTAAAVVAIGIVGSGLVAWMSERQTNERVLDQGTELIAEVYQSGSGRYPDLKLEYEVDGQSYRSTIPSGFFSRLSRLNRGDSVVVFVDAEDPNFVRTSERGNYSNSARFRLVGLPFAAMIAWLSRGSFIVGRELRNAQWYPGWFEIRKTGSVLKASIWDNNGHLVTQANKMQGRVRSGRARSPCYFAPMGKRAMAVPVNDREGVLVVAKREIALSGQVPVTIRDDG